MSISEAQSACLRGDLGLLQTILAQHKEFVNEEDANGTFYDFVY